MIDNLPLIIYKTQMPNLSKILKHQFNKEEKQTVN